MEIQKTTVSELEGERARIGIQISDHEDVEQSSQYVVFSVLVSTEPIASDTRPVSFRVLQTRALKEAIALLDQADKVR